MTRLSRPNRSSDGPYPGTAGRAAFLSTTAIVGVVAVLSASPARAQTTWTGAVSSDWFTAGNWSGGVPGGNPSSNSQTTINPTAVAPVIGAPGAVDGFLTVNGSLLIQNGGTLRDQ